MTTAVASTEWLPEVSIGDRLRVIRRSKNRTQDEMADLLGVKKGTYGAWESGRNHPTHREVVEIARRLNMLDRVPQWWTLGADEPTDSLRASARSSTDRASDYGSRVALFSSAPQRRASDRRRLGVLPLYLRQGSDLPALGLVRAQDIPA